MGCVISTTPVFISFYQDFIVSNPFNFNIFSHTPSK